MVKRQINQTEIEVTTKEGVDKRVEHTLIVDDSVMPSPDELRVYKEIDPRFIDHFLEMTKAEQTHRHRIAEQKLSIIDRTESSEERMNLWGMSFAFMSLVLFIGITAYALYLDSPWFAGFFAVSSVVTIISIFVKAGSKNRDSQ